MREDARPERRDDVRILGTCKSCSTSELPLALRDPLLNEDRGRAKQIQRHIRGASVADNGSVRLLHEADFDHTVELLHEGLLAVVTPPVNTEQR